jgi:hypothetical protein
MAAESKEQGGEPADLAFDDLIRNLLTEAGQSTQTAMRGPMAALMEIVTAPPSRPTARTSMLEKVLLAETIASAMANAIAPAIAETLAPEILKALESHGSERSKDQSESMTSSGEGGRKAPAKQ